MRLPLLGTRRDRAERYLFVTVAAFAASVAVTRWFLASAGYPKVGGGGLHIAHMLWGGLLLVVASLLPLLFTGQRILSVSALAAGIGVGLFIDEIGKFITETNNYFFAPAAPLIYGSILLFVALLVVVSRRRDASARGALHAAAEALADAADGTLTRARRDAIAARLSLVSDAELGPLARQLEADLAAGAVERRLAPAGWLEDGRALRLLERLLPARLERALVVIGLVTAALLAVFAMLLLAVMLDVGSLPLTPPSGPVEFPDSQIWLALVLVVAAGVGVASGIAAVLLLAGREGLGLRIAMAATLVNLVGGGLLTFYVSQFTSMSTVLLHLVLLTLVVDDQRRLRARQD